ncbi:MAG TPA: dihydrofolate reductase [Candidatus Polarisedimenticolia bacterium]|nr:dihydrofolate reductase [Candidatus Polarisedimenticolia bacterium]
MTVSLIAAMDPRRVIGLGNRLPWRLPADLARFKRLTMGHALIMGRRTFESIGRALPGRRTIVVSRRPGYAPEGVETAASLEEALRRAQAIEGDDGEAFVAGGGEIFAAALPLADRMHLTLLDREYEGDAWFPAYDPAHWTPVGEESHPASGGLPAYRFVTLERLPRRCLDSGMRGR